MTIESVEPADGTEGFPRDGSIRIQLRVWPTDITRNFGRNFSVRVVRVRDGVEVPGELHKYSGVDSWTPSDSFLAHETYRVVVTSARESWSDMPGPITSTTTFTTSDAFSPELSLDGPLRARLRRGVAAIRDCGPCGGVDCVQTGERPALYADVDLPTVRGGFDDYGYAAWLTLNDNAARVFDGPGEGKQGALGELNVSSFVQPSPGSPNQRTVEVPREDKIRDVCFGFNVWDPNGRSKSAEPLCLSAATVAAAFGISDAGLESKAFFSPHEATREADGGAFLPPPDATGEADGGGSSSDAGGTHEAPPRHVRSGCSIAAGQQTAYPPLAMLVVVALVVGRLGRRGRRNSVR